jgi:hypothetical protein
LCNTTASKSNDNNINTEESNFAAERVYYYHKIQPILVNSHEKKYTIYPEKYPLDLEKYKEELFNAIDSILEALGFDVEALRKELLTGVSIKEEGNSP